ncbi:MAG: hypothetical protein ING66_14085 [Rhodocyclaceae bacterium]|nr:hypothetical protein [Rhodocyclaceae bacterium]MCA3059576.1 hypothetical protein [Rhodocyclaceae bacterium]MCA3084261.1 hypothetical protein [Rhodocyclaceae bacterium]
MLRFYEFDPYATFIAHGDGAFYRNEADLSRIETQLPKASGTHLRLWSLGRRAMIDLSHRGNPIRQASFSDNFTIDDLTELGEVYVEFSGQLKESLEKLADTETTVLIDENGLSISTQQTLNLLSNYDAPLVLQTAFERRREQSLSDESATLWQVALLFGALERIGNAFWSIGENDWEWALEASMDAAEMYSWSKEVIVRTMTHQQARSEHAAKGANARHEETRALKEEAKNYYEKNRQALEQNNSEAARQIEKLVPVKFRTAYKWVAEFKVSH